MQIFVTGASGFIGSAIVQDLLAAGHTVLGLARSDASAAAIAAAGAQVHRGSLHDLDSLKRGAALSDGVIHTAYIHDFSQMENNAKVDLAAVEAIASALEASNKPFVISSGTLMVSPGRVATENDASPVDHVAAHRFRSEVAVLDAAQRGVRSMVLRLPPTVHGEGDHGFVPRLIDIARKDGVSAYIGDGCNRWPAVHRFDAARLYRLAIEHGAPGSRFHGVAEEGVPTREIAAAIGRRLNVPVASISAEHAAEHFGFLGRLLDRDAPASSAQTRQQLHWRPTHAGLIADIEG